MARGLCSARLTFPWYSGAILPLAGERRSHPSTIAMADFRQRLRPAEGAYRITALPLEVASKWLAFSFPLLSHGRESFIDPIDYGRSDLHPRISLRDLRMHFFYMALAF